MSALRQWIPVSEAFKLLGHSSDRPLRRDLSIGKYASDWEDSPTGRRRMVDLLSLPHEAQSRYWKSRPETAELLTADSHSSDPEIEMELLDRAPAWARKKAHKYIALIRATEGMKGEALKFFLAEWNQKYPDMASSYPRLMDAKKAYEVEGMAALLADYGKKAGRTSVREDWFEFFKSIYLKEGGPGVYHSWLTTYGFCRKMDATLTKENFPSYKAFENLLKKKVSEDAIFLAREGYARYNRKFAAHATRDYSQLLPGQCWVSDHMQLDVAVLLPSGKACFPWLTWWLDFRTCKGLGWTLHADDPNSDHIFQSFFYAARDFGLPDEIYIDNGKDYRSRDFSSGRRVIKAGVDDGKTRSMLGGLNIATHFSLPYRAQSKIIERIHLKIKTMFAKMMPGYRGGNVVERPEALEEELRAGKIMRIEDCQQHFDSFMTRFLNNLPSEGRILDGLSPNQFWANHFGEGRALRRVGIDALKLFCARTSREVAIGRNGVHDSQLGLVYWGEWMAGMKGKKVYLRRDIKAYQDAWVFSGETDEYLGRATLVQSINAIVRTDIDKKQLKDAMAAQRQNLKLTRAMAATAERPSPADLVEYMAEGAVGLGGVPDKTKSPAAGAQIEITEMDRVIAKDKQMEKAGGFELPKHPQPKKRAKLFTYDFEREEAEKSAKRDLGT